MQRPNKLGVLLESWMQSGRQVSDSSNSFLKVVLCLLTTTMWLIRTCEIVDNGAYFNRLPMPPRLDHIHTIYVDFLRTYFSISTYLIFVNFDISTYLIVSSKAVISLSVVVKNV